MKALGGGGGSYSKTSKKAEAKPEPKAKPKPQKMSHSQLVGQWEAQGRDANGKLYDVDHATLEATPGEDVYDEDAVPDGPWTPCGSRAG